MGPVKWTKKLSAFGIPLPQYSLWWKLITYKIFCFFSLNTAFFTSFEPMQSWQVTRNMKTNCVHKLFVYVHNFVHAAHHCSKSGKTQMYVILNWLRNVYCNLSVAGGSMYYDIFDCVHLVLRQQELFHFSISCTSHFSRTKLTSFNTISPLLKFTKINSDICSFKNKSVATYWNSLSVPLVASECRSRSLWVGWKRTL